MEHRPPAERTSFARCRPTRRPTPTGGQDSGVDYQYAPRTPELRATIGRLADLYAARRLTVASLIGQRPSESLRLCSDAFRLWEDE
jgi:hypothetical protein